MRETASKGKRKKKKKYREDATVEVYGEDYYSYANCIPRVNFASDVLHKSSRSRDALNYVPWQSINTGFNGELQTAAKSV